MKNLQLFAVLVIMIICASFVSADYVLVSPQNITQAYDGIHLDDSEQEGTGFHIFDTNFDGAGIVFFNLPMYVVIDFYIEQFAISKMVVNTTSTPVNFTLEASEDCNTWVMMVNVTEGSDYVEREFNNSISYEFWRFSSSGTGVVAAFKQLQFFVNYSCSPSWSCIGYDACLLNDSQLCNSVNDSNSCGENYSGDYTEFEPQTCDYCTPSWVCSDFDTCLDTNVSACLNVSDGNGCFAETSLSSDEFNGSLSDYDNSSCGYEEPCSPSWSCSRFSGYCNNGRKECFTVTDSSNCNVTFNGSLSDYSATCAGGSGGGATVTAIQPVQQPAKPATSSMSSSSSSASSNTIKDLFSTVWSWITGLFE